MKKLAEQNEKNSPEEYDRIFFDRILKGVDESDLRRWKALLKHFKGGRLIDMGCLDSLVPQLAKERFPKAECWGIDLAPETIATLQARFPEIFYEVQDVYHTKFPDGYFSYVVAGELMEHLESPQDFIKEAFRILKKGGVLALSTPLEEAVEPGAVDGERHLWSFSQQDMYDLVAPYKPLSLGAKRLGSVYFPTYQYHFPNIIVWFKK